MNDSEICAVIFLMPKASSGKMTYLSIRNPKHATFSILLSTPELQKRIVASLYR
jgi:hypothetical protein